MGASSWAGGGQRRRAAARDRRLGAGGRGRAEQFGQRPSPDTARPGVRRRARTRRRPGRGAAPRARRPGPQGARTRAWPRIYAACRAQSIIDCRAGCCLCARWRRCAANCSSRGRESAAVGARAVVPGAAEVLRTPRAFATPFAPAAGGRAKCMRRMLSAATPSRSFAARAVVRRRGGSPQFARLTQRTPRGGDSNVGLPPSGRGRTDVRRPRPQKVSRKSTACAARRTRSRTTAREPTAADSLPPRCPGHEPPPDATRTTTPRNLRTAPCVPHA